MKNSQRGFVVPLLIIIAVLVIGGGIYFWQKNKNTVPVSVVSSSTSADTTGWQTYDNFGIEFQYPALWGVPRESFYASGLGSVYFDYNASDTQSFDIFVEQDTNPNGIGLSNETFDQMIDRFRSNDKYIYEVTDISADGVEGKELFYNNAVTGQPYNVEAYFPFQNGTYISIGADYQSVPQSVFDSIISTLKWDSATAFRQDPVTGMATYSNNGIQFEYPVKFNTDYASLNLQTIVLNQGGSNIDANGCYVTYAASGKISGSQQVTTTNNIKFCLTQGSDVGAGQADRSYIYTTSRGGNYYVLDYVVHTSNGCGVYQNSPDLSAPENQKYNECLDFSKNYETLVTQPIQQSISTFKFTN